MHKPTSRRLAALLLLLYLLSLLPAASPAQADNLQDAADRFWQQRTTISGRRDLPASFQNPPASAGATSQINQADRLAQLRSRWAKEQTRDLLQPRAVTPSLVYLPTMGLPGTAVAEQPAAPVEVADYRTATSKLYSLPNGRWQARVYGQPIHYQQADGRWESYAPQLQPLKATESLSGYQVTGTDLDLRFAGPTSAQPLAPDTHLVEVGDGTLALGFTPQDADLTAARVQDATITYAGAFSNADLRYTATGPGLKEEVIFHRRPAADFALRFVMQIQGGSLDQRGTTILVRDSAGQARWTITPPFMVDRQGATSDDITVALEPAANGTYTLSYTPSAAWLSDPARAYPVTLDPTLEAYLSGDTYAASNDTATDQHHGENSLLLGNSPTSTERRRIYLQFDVRALPAGVVPGDIVNAQLRLYQHTDEHGGSYPVRLHRTVDPWAEHELNWPNQPDRAATPAPIAETVSAGAGMKSLDVTAIVRGWYNDPVATPYRGLAIFAADEAQKGGRFTSYNCMQLSPSCHNASHPNEDYAHLVYEYESVARRNELYLTESLQFAPSPRSARGTAVTATFKVQNVGSRHIFIPAFRVNMTKLSTGATSPFATAANIRLAPGASYTYSQSQTLAEAGRYKGEAQFFNGTTWYRIYIPRNSTLTNVREHIVQAAKPPRQARTLGARGKNGKAGEPVNTSTGNFSATAIDATLPDAGLSLSFGRTFNSLDTTTIGSFGPGWAATYDERLLRQEDESVVYVREDGQQVYFEAGFDEVLVTEPEDPDGDIGTIEYRPNGSYTVEDGFDLSLVRDINTGVWTLADPDFTTTAFDPAGRLQRITDRHGSTLTAGYDAGPLTTLRTAHYSCTVGWANSRITSIACPTGTLRYGYNAANDLQSVTDLSGATTSYAYDDLHRLTRITDGNGRLVVENVYDAEGRVLDQREGITGWTRFNYDTGTRTSTYLDANGRTLTDTYDDGDRLLQRVDALGNTERYTYDADDHLLSYTNPLGATWRYTYDARGNLVSETDPLNATWSYSYDDRNQRVTATDPLGQTTRYSYSQDRLQTETDPLNGRQSYTTTPEGLVLSATDALGRTTSRTYTSSGQIATETDPSGATTSYEYNAAGNQTAVIDALGQRAEYVYDAQHRLTRLTHPDGSVERFAYDSLGNLISQTNRLGATRSLFYDGNNRLIGETDYRGAVTEHFYDGTGNRVRTVDALKETTTFGYDAIGQLISRTDRLGATWTYTYDSAGRLLTETDPLGRKITHQYDAVGRETRTIDARGNAVTRTYDALSRTATETDLLGATTTFGYDALGRLLSSTDAVGRVTRSTYDAVGNLLATTDAVGKQTTREYDANNRLLIQTDRMGATTRYRYDRLGRLTAQTNPRGATTTTDYDALDRPVRITDALGNRVSTAYDAEGRRLREIDERGFSRTWSYDADGRPVTATDRVGATTTTEYDALGRVVRVTDALGGVTTMRYDAEGRLIEQTNPIGQTQRTTYDAVGNAVRVVDGRGFATTTEYDPNDNPIRTIDPLGHATRTVYNVANQPVQEIDALGNVQTTQYDALGRVVATSDPYGAATTTAYDNLDRVIGTTDPRGATTSLEYDAEGRAVRTLDAFKHATTRTYDVMGAPLSVTDPLGRRARTEYDLLGRVVKTIDALGHVATTSYDPAGNVIRETDPRGATTSMEYDTEGRLIKRVDALGYVWRTEYDRLGRPTRAIDPFGNATTTAYDAAGNPVRVVQPSGQTTRMIYDAAGNVLAQTDARGFVTTHEYDALNRAIATKDPLGYTTRRQYDAAGNLIATIDGKGQATRLAYDKARRLISVADPLAHTIQIRYDPAGAPIETLDGNGHRTRTEYDLLGRSTARYDALSHRTLTSYDAVGNPIAEQRPNGARITTDYDALNRPTTVKLSSGETHTMAYDPAGNVTARTAADGQQTIVYDLLGRPVRYADSAAQTVQWQYDAAGRRTTTIYPDGRAVATSYNANGWPTTIVDRRGNVINAAYDDDGRLLDLRYPASALRWAYNSTGEVTAVLNEGNNGAFAAYEYTLDANRQRTHERISELTLGGLITLEETAYTYDAADRLIRSVRSGPTTSALDQRYSYDAAGNRTAITATEAGTSWTQQSRYDSADRLIEQIDSRSGTTAFSYDPAGQRLSAAGSSGQQRYTYDALGRLTGLTLLNTAGATTGSQTMVYDALNRRIMQQERAPNGTLRSSERTLYSGDEWNVLSQAVAGQTPHWFVSQPQGLDHLSVEIAGAVRFAHTDGLGSYVAYTDGQGAPQGGAARYGDWGNVESGAANLAGGYGYTGHRQDAGGLLYARNRSYDPATATWLTPDPFPADERASGSLNRYSYVRGNPISRTDPLGLFDTDLDLSSALEGGAWDSGAWSDGDAAASTTISAGSHASRQRDGAVAHGTSGARCGSRCGTSYAVKRGNSLGEIAARFHVPWRWIANANREAIGANRQVRSGQTLYIPCSDPGTGATQSGRQYRSVTAVASRSSKPTNPDWDLVVSLARDKTYKKEFDKSIKIPVIKKRVGFKIKYELKVNAEASGSIRKRNACINLSGTGSGGAELELPVVKIGPSSRVTFNVKVCAFGKTTGDVSIATGINLTAKLKAFGVGIEAGVDGRVSYGFLSHKLTFRVELFAKASLPVVKDPKISLPVTKSFKFP